MSWSAIWRAIRCIKRGIPSFKQNGLQVPRQVSNLHNVTVAVNVVQQPVSQLAYRTSFFYHWLKMTSYSARLRCSPIYRTMANKKRSSLYLAFIGLGYLGCNNNLNLSKPDEHLDNWLHKALKETVKVTPEKFTTCEGKKLKDFELGDRLGKRSANSAVYAAKCQGNQYAIKMLFNYHAGSQSHSLYQAFSKELTVMSPTVGNENSLKIENSRYQKLPPHPNIMKVVGSFADDVPKLPDAAQSYPAALPFHHGGHGKNRTLFLVMPRFSSTLSEYIENCGGNLSQRTSLALLTQFLEGLVHLTKNHVAHRDLKADNLLVNQVSVGLPHLVITDFGCCLAEKHLGFEMPYETDETGKGGNYALMAPEVAVAKPGRGHVIDYSKADEWSAVVLAYEIFGQQNPFEESGKKKERYESKDLPEIRSAPKILKKLAKKMLARHPNDRPDISLSATICQLLLWAPLRFHCSMWNVEREDVERWYRSKTLSLTMEMLKYEQIEENIPVGKQMLCTFLSRSSVDAVVEALEWMAWLENNEKCL